MSCILPKRNIRGASKPVKAEKKNISQTAVRVSLSFLRPLNFFCHVYSLCKFDVKTIFDFEVIVRLVYLIGQKMSNKSEEIFSRSIKFCLTKILFDEIFSPTKNYVQNKNLNKLQILFSE